MRDELNKLYYEKLRKEELIDRKLALRFSKEIRFALDIKSNLETIHTKLEEHGEVIFAREYASEAGHLLLDIVEEWELRGVRVEFIDIGIKFSTDLDYSAPRTIEAHEKPTEQNLKLMLLKAQAELSQRKRDDIKRIGEQIEKEQAQKEEQIEERREFSESLRAELKFQRKEKIGLIIERSIIIIAIMFFICVIIIG